MKWVKLAVLSHYTPIWWEKIGKAAKRVKLVILHHIGGKRCKMGEIGHSKSLYTTSVGKDWKHCETGKIGHSESFSTASVGKDWKSGETGKIGHSESFT